MAEQLELGHGASIPLGEIELRASRSGGPGGQHANKTETRIEAVFDVAGSRSLSPDQRRRISERLGPRVTAVAQDARSQARNRELALERLRDRLAGALAPRRRRRPARPRRAARERRLEQKRKTADRKRGRRRPRADEY